MKRAATLLAVAMAAGCAAVPPRITGLGDSTTAGVTQSAGGSAPAARDPLGGWPGRLGRLLGDRARVTNRGLGGSTTSLWLTPPDGTWRGTPVRDFLLGNGWDFVPPPGAETLALAVLRADRPTIVLVLLGVNDLSFEVPERGGAATVAETVVRLRTLRAQALTVARVALVSTVLPNRHHPPELTEALNAGIRSAFPDYLPLAERFAAAGGTALLGDEVHPSEEGYQVLGEAVARELETRGLVAHAR